MSNPLTMALAVAQGISLVTGAMKTANAYDNYYNQAIQAGEQNAQQLQLEGAIKMSELEYKATLSQGLVKGKLAGQQAPLTGSALDVLMQEARHDDMNMAVLDYSYDAKSANALRYAYQTASSALYGKSTLTTNTLANLTNIGLSTWQKTSDISTAKQMSELKMNQAYNSVFGDISSQESYLKESTGYSSTTPATQYFSGIKVPTFGD